MMTNRLPVSVCMTVYNGEKFLKEQIDSIILQLDNINDELIIVNDFSKDSSLEIIQSYRNKQIKIYNNQKNIGFIKSFEKAIELSQNPIVFLSDQDDIWISNRLEKMYHSLEQSDNLLLCSNFNGFDVLNQNLQRFKKKLVSSDSNKNFKNVLSIFKGDIAYFGCTMAFKKEFKKNILPFPDFLPTHDLWIAMIANLMGKITHMEEITLEHRIHGNNASFVSRKLTDKIYTRLLFLRAVLLAFKRKNINSY